MKVTPSYISSINNCPLQEIKTLDLHEKEIKHIEDISACSQLNRINLSKNCIQNSDALSGIQYCESMKHIDISHNQLTELTCFSRFKCKPVVLNLSYNQLTTISPNLKAFGASLHALIMAGNKISSLYNIEAFTNLETLILSNNLIEDASFDFSLLPNLKKLNMSSNSLHGVPDVSKLELLKELRLNNNKIFILKSLPVSIEVLDLGKCLLEKFENIQALKYCSKLVNLNLKGNPICAHPNYKEKILELVPSLRILDGERFDEKFLDRKKKREIIQKIIHREEKEQEIKMRVESGESLKDIKREKRLESKRKRKELEAQGKLKEKIKKLKRKDVDPKVGLEFTNFEETDVPSMNKNLLLVKPSKSKDEESKKSKKSKREYEESNKSKKEYEESNKSKEAYEESKKSRKAYEESITKKSKEQSKKSPSKENEKRTIDKPLTPIPVNSEAANEIDERIRKRKDIESVNTKVHANVKIHKKESKKEDTKVKETIIDHDRLGTIGGGLETWDD